MKVTVLVLGVALLCIAAVGAQDGARGRERLRELVQKARAGDVEAQTILASRRRKIGSRNKDGAGRRGDNRETSAVQSILGGVSPRRPVTAPTAAPVASSPVRTRLPTRTRQRGESSRSRSRGSSRTTTQADVTTFRPRFRGASLATTPVPARSPVQLLPVPVTFKPPHVDLTPTNNIPSMFQSAQFGSGGRGVQAVKEILLAPRPIAPVLVEEPVFKIAPAPQHVDLTPTSSVPSLFQSAQFGAGGRGVQAVNTITRPTSRPVTRPVSRPVTRPVSRQRTRLEPHRAIQRGLETGSRSEVITADQQANADPTPRPVQTTRRYSYFDEQGNYIFGYEDEDGTFKEEIRGKDCIVNGKYGYVDPDGVRREFTYVSGNKCDPKNPEANLVDGVGEQVINDQFLHQTQETVLTQSELSSLNFNRRRRPVQQNTQQNTRTVPQRTVPQRTSSSRNRISQSRTRPAPKPVQQIPQAHAVKPVDLTPTNEIPSMFQPAQFGGEIAARRPAPAQDRFPAPDFVSSSRPRSQPSRPQVQHIPQAPAVKSVDLTPTNEIPSMFQPAQFGGEIVARRPTPAQDRFLAPDFVSSSRPRSRPSRPQIQQIPQAPAVKPVDLTPTNEIPSMFRPAQFGGEIAARRPAPVQDRFPVPDFLSSSRPRSRASRPQERERKQEPVRRRKEEQQPAKPVLTKQADTSPHFDLTPSQVVPSMFQSAQFGPGGRGVQAQATVTRPPVNFNFDQEFRSVFSHFDNIGAPREIARPTPRPTTPRPRPPPTTRRPTTRAPAPTQAAVPSLFQPAQFGGQQAIPSLFQPAQFGGQQPRPVPTRAPVPFVDNSLTLTSQSTGGHQLVFDASTGTFKTVQIQTSNRFGAPPPAPQPTQAAPRPTSPPRQRPRPTPAPTAPPRQTFTPQTTGRPLFGSASTGNNPLPPIPTSAAEFDHFFAQFG